MADQHDDSQTPTATPVSVERIVTPTTWWQRHGNRRLAIAAGLLLMALIIGVITWGTSDNSPTGPVATGTTQQAPAPKRGRKKATA